MLLCSILVILFNFVLKKIFLVEIGLCVFFRWQYIQFDICFFLNDLNIQEVCIVNLCLYFLQEKGVYNYFGDIVEEVIMFLIKLSYDVFIRYSDQLRVA